MTTLIEELERAADAHETIEGMCIEKGSTQSAEYHARAASRLRSRIAHVKATLSYWDKITAFDEESVPVQRAVKDLIGPAMDEPGV